MASLRQIRGRIKSTQNSKQIMRAMQLVSGSKLKRAHDRLLQAREVLGFLDEMLQRVLVSVAARESRVRGRQKSAGLLRHPLCERRNSGASALVIFTSDAGLCGSYNTNLMQLADAHLRQDRAASMQVIYIGKKGYRYFTKRGYAAAEAYLDLAGRPNPAKTEAIGRALMERFLSGSVSSVKLLYSTFKSASAYRPTTLDWLPIQLEPANPRAREPANAVEYIFEPSAKEVFEDLLPRWALAKFQLVMLEAFTSEHSARMIAMKNATDNAQELVDSLTSQRNKIRQAAITKELSEIVGTVEALK